MTEHNKDGASVDALSLKDVHLIFPCFCIYYTYYIYYAYPIIITQTVSNIFIFLLLGMHLSGTQDRYRLRSGHFLWIGYRSDETDPNPILCVYYSVLLLSPMKATKIS